VFFAGTAPAIFMMTSMAGIAIFLRGIIKPSYSLASNAVVLLAWVIQLGFWMDYNLVGMSKSRGEHVCYWLELQNEDQGLGLMVAMLVTAGLLTIL
jgi:hypothetical protein